MLSVEISKISNNLVNYDEHRRISTFFEKQNELQAIAYIQYFVIPIVNTLCDATNC